MLAVTLGGDAVSLLTHTYHTTVILTWVLMFDLMIANIEYGMVIAPNVLTETRVVGAGISMI